YGAAYHHAVGLAYAHYRQAVAGETTLVGELRRTFAAADVILAQRPAIALLSVRAQIDQQRPRLHVAHQPEAAVTFRREMVQRAIARGELQAADGIHVQRLLDVFLWGLSVIGYEDAHVRRESLRAIERFVAMIGRCPPGG
ncbi:MAG: hypothetical protein OEY41_05130, partial [Acidimicrobiia bacterium]|nr:hypothetical protein [Acidimicrobiia bacterium]